MPYSETEKVAARPPPPHIKPMPLLSQDPIQIHQWSRFPIRGYCIWYKEHAEKCEPKRERPPLAEIVNSAGPAKRKRQSKTYGGCIAYKAFLCLKGACFKEYHNKKNTK
jgi:hypothetical protein